VRVLGVGPFDVAGHVPVARLDGAGEEDDREHQQHRGHPGESRDQLGDKGRAVAGRGYGVAHGYVAVGRHDQQEDRRGEGGDRGAHHVGLAHVVAEGPVAHLHGVQQEGYADQEALVGDGQIQDVYIRDRLHLGEAHYNIDDQGVAKQPDDADQGVQDHRDQLQDEVVAVRAICTRILVVVQVVAPITRHSPVFVVQLGPHVGRHCSIEAAICGSVKVTDHRFHELGVQLLRSGSIWRHGQLLCGRY